MPAYLAWLAALAFLAFGLAPANAQEPAAEIAGTLSASLEALDGVTVTYDAASGSGDSVTIENFSVSLASGPSLTAPAIVLSGVAPRDAGGFTATSLSIDNGTLSSGGRTAKWASATVGDVIVPSPEEVKDRARIRPFASVAMTGIELGGEAIASRVAIAGAQLSVAEISDEMPTAITASAEGVQLPASLMGQSFLSVLVALLNYEEFTADISLDAAYDPAADKAVMNSFAVDVATVGRIDLTATASNFSVSGISNPDPEVAQAARSAARLETARIRIENEGFIERMLAMQAEMLGGTTEDVRRQIVDGALPFALSFVKNEAFREAFRAEFGEFLADPQSLTITVSPAEPLPLGQVARALARAPLTLPDLLAPTVAANEPPPAPAPPPVEEPQP